MELGRRILSTLAAVTLGAMTVVWLVKSALGIQTYFLYRLFGWPYTVVTGIIVALEIWTMCMARPHETPPRPKEHWISKMIKLVTLWVPTLFACAFVFLIRTKYDIGHGWWSRVFKNIFIIIGLLALCIYRTFTTWRYIFRDQTFKVPGHRLTHILVQMSCFYGMVDAVSYSIFASDRFTNYGDTYHDTSLTFYRAFMFSVVMNGMMWFRFSHEFYAIMSNHDCEIPIRHLDFGFRSRHRCTWLVVFLLWIGAFTTQVIYRFRGPETVYWGIDSITTTLCVLVIIIVFIRWLCHNLNQLTRHHPGIDHEHFYFVLAGIISVISVWYANEESSWLQLANTTANSVAVIVQIIMLCFSIPTHGFFRLFLIFFNVAELINAVFNELKHYDHTYHLYKEDEKLPTPFIVLTFLSWSLLETLLFIIEFHLAHLLSSHVDYENPEERLPLNGQTKVVYNAHGHDEAVAVPVGNSEVSSFSGVISADAPPSPRRPGFINDRPQPAAFDFTQLHRSFSETFKKKKKRRQVRETSTKSLNLESMDDTHVDVTHWGDNPITPREESSFAAAAQSPHFDHGLGEEEL